MPKMFFDNKTKTGNPFFKKGKDFSLHRKPTS